MTIKANARSLNALRSEYLTVVRKLILKKRGTTEENIKTIKVAVLL